MECVFNVEYAEYHKYFDSKKRYEFEYSIPIKSNYYNILFI